MDLHNLPDVLRTGIHLAEHFGPSAIGTIGGILRGRSQAGKIAAEIARVDIEISRLGDLIESLNSEVRELHAQGRWNIVVAETQAVDPEFQVFAEAAIENAAISESEAKRRLFGRYIVRRLQTESDEQIILLRRAMGITRDLTERQILALAAVTLVQNLQSPPATFQV